MRVLAIQVVIIVSVLIGIFLAIMLIGTGYAQQPCNCGPNNQYPQPPINSPVQSIHPK